MITSLSIGRGGLGRFGNQAFTIAGVIGTAIKSGQPYAFPEWLNHDNKLFGGEVDNINSELLNPLPILPEGLIFDNIPYFWGYRDLHLPTGNWSIDAHMQSEKFFKHCMPLIRETFTFKDEPEQNDYVAIHYRAGDYIDDPNAYHPRCSMAYYINAINSFPDDTRFILFSDNIEAIDKLRHNKDWFVRIEVTNGNYIDDFKIMKKCKSFITANSSFSLMAAILGGHPDKKIVCPKRWFGSQAGDIETKDIYPEGAIIL